MITQSELKKQLIYNGLTGIFTWNLAKAGVSIGSIAGSNDGKGYVMLKINREKHLAHRLAFLYMTGEVPKHVDHINHIRNDNKWSNLRPSSFSINGKNQRLYKNNKSGFCGVRFHKTLWEASITSNKMYIYLGSFKSKKDAINARKEANIKHGFHTNHGE